MYAPQCSAGGEFCFFCEFNEATDAPDECVVAELKAMTKILVESRKELPVIVTTLRQKYNEEIRGEVEYRNKSTGQLVRGPDWSEVSIQKHLIFSSEFPQIADLVVHHVYMSMLMNINGRMICSQTGEVREEARKAFSETALSLSRWRKSTGLDSDGRQTHSK
jgi:hypothetical protein